MNEQHDDRTRPLPGGQDDQTRPGDQQDAVPTVRLTSTAETEPHQLEPAGGEAAETAPPVGATPSSEPTAQLSGADPTAPLAQTAHAAQPAKIAEAPVAGAPGTEGATLFGEPPTRAEPVRAPGDPSLTAPPAPLATPMDPTAPASAAPAAPPAGRKPGPRTGPIVWGALVLAFCGYIAQRVFGTAEFDAGWWVAMTTIALGALLLLVGAAVVIRGLGSRR